MPELDPIENMKISDETLIKNIKQLDDFTKRYNEHPVRNRSDFQEIYNDFKRRISIQKEYQEAKKNYSNAQKLVRSEELRNRKRVLRRLQYATDEDTITDKASFVSVVQIPILFNRVEWLANSVLPMNYFLRK